MAKNKGWITPFKKQCFVTFGVCLNMAAHGLVMGFNAILLPQLRQPDSIIPIDDTSGSWIASIIGFALVAGNFIVPPIMANYGRRTANIVSVTPLLVGWFSIILAKSVPVLLVARFLQGMAMGISASLGPVLIGEYTSPQNRGAFLTMISLCIATGVLTVHTMGSFMHWQTTALVCGCIAFVDLIIIIYSPESPSWLADQGRYEECKQVFRWLRNEDEEEELQKMIEASVIVRESKEEANISQSLGKRIKSGVVYFSATIKKKEFYKPIFLMMHIYTLGQWAGANILAAYTTDIVHNIIGTEFNTALLIITLDSQRIISNALAVLVIKKINRRTMLFSTVIVNIISFLATAAYTYFKGQGTLPPFLDHPGVGVALIHIHMFTIATGTVPLPFIIAGEVFPLEYRSLAGGISVLFLSSNLFITVKTVPFFFGTLGIHGAYCIYAAVVGYCLVVAYFFLPETKDRTLQDIENEFRGRPLSPDEVKSTQSLASWKLHSKDRRCSSPVV
ncbi:facilitated trehalose transporter Tret1-like [Trichoplusia ni]|uniref:Facilitated trehalose transporter Tret1-like n=1 Tax=Trichoplusia ni TaxID=7111 RepID=A0A7E5VQN7_TRINI|nr:facilitated trehalose transporter Tret1-like [Trichoplusia ni]XP_026730579.1 facilitated trehalose transporter Tret1-like [Trichoplusia ni]XP_026730580.1 facilitated trehalose transporter Tret1-like [Trichoplusia ni]XP_026730581.1 facilitated trehalose transporter Tret1-like [Trichoplusia ni]XP_026730582.1 facilitated trehalose transporter Tret1-like [Trichoplusia ni]XP_026730583.1 facilitated trehalose transporter Tret1-like [Trichoplusia ni]